MTEPYSPITRRAAILLGATVLAGLLLPRSARALEGRWTRDIRGPLPHPDPRPGITADKVLKDDELGSSKAVHEAYAVARAHPEIFDGLYCVCECKESMGHRSLLSCFESRQATGCWGCREQAELVAELLKKGETLEQIRKAFDAKWG